ncbi:MAG TPA: PilZ domain-containing protein [Rhizomicrobium sp.]
MGQDEPIANKRIGDRRRLLKAGRIVFGQGRSVIDCTVRSVSRTGAMLNVQNAVTVPQEFELRWDGNVRRCTVVWRKVASLGVKFDT